MWTMTGVYTLIRNLSGEYLEFIRIIRTPDGLHQDAWGSVTYS